MAQKPRRRGSVPLIVASWLLKKVTRRVSEGYRLCRTSGLRGDLFLAYASGDHVLFIARLRVGLPRPSFFNGLLGFGINKRQGGIDVWVQTLMHGAVSGGGFQRFAMSIIECNRDSDGDGQSSDASRWFGRHVLFNV